MSQTSPAAPPLPRRSWWSFLLRAFVTFLGLTLLGSIAGFLVFRYLAMSRLEQARAEADRLDPGWRWEEIQRTRAWPPETENSAIITAKVIALLPRRWDAALHATPDSADANGTQPASLYDRMISRPPNERCTDDFAAAVREVRLKTTDALAVAHQLAERPHGRLLLPALVDYNATGLGFQEHRDVAHLLMFDALLRTHEGDLDGAVRSIRCILNTSGAIGDEPNLIAQTVRTAIENIATADLERVLGQGTASVAELERLQEIIQHHLREPRLLTALRGERAFGDRTQQGMPPPKDPLSVLYLQATGLHDQVCAELLESQTQCIELAKLPLADQRVAFNNLEREHAASPPPTTAGSVLVRLRVPTVVKIATSEARRQAIQGAAILALAAERYRLRHGQWPDKIDDLKPLVQTIPVDPFGSGPLKMTRTADGVIFYSVGYDEEDNGGKLDRAKPNAKGVDLGFQLWDANQRRRVVRPDTPAPEMPP